MTKAIKYYIDFVQFRFVIPVNTQSTSFSKEGRETLAQLKGHTKLFLKLYF